MATFHWASTAKTKLKKPYNQQKQAVRTVFNQKLNISLNVLYTELSALNVYKGNIFQSNVYPVSLKLANSLPLFKIKHKGFLTNLNNEEIYF